MPKSLDSAGSSRPQPLSTAQRSLIPQLYLLLSSAIEMLGADKGNIQFFDKRSNSLRLMVQIGFKDDYLRHYSCVMPGYLPCGIAYNTRKRLIIDDVDNDAEFCHLSSIFKNHGYRAMQATPLLDNRQVFGILSTHFCQPHRPDENQLGMLDAYLTQAIPIILRRRKTIKTLLPDESVLPQRSFPFMQSF